jgi:hypothetical protein
MNLTQKLVLILVVLLVVVYIFRPHQAKAFTVGVVVPPPVVVVSPSNYQNCVDTCLAYNGYNSDAYYFCQNECGYQPSVIVPVWVGGIWYPHGYRHFEPRHDDPRHDYPHYNGRR